jgi:hypothetical protein
VTPHPVHRHRRGVTSTELLPARTNRVRA